MKEIMAACEIFQNRFFLIKKNVEDYIRPYPNRKDQILAIKQSWQGWQENLALKILDKKSIDSIFILECLKKIIKNQISDEKRKI